MRHSFRSYLILILLLIASLSASKSTSDTLRAGAVSLFSPFFSLSSSQPGQAFSEETQKIALKNTLLEREIAELRLMLKQEAFLYHDRLNAEKIEAALPATVIFRPLNNWNSSLWVSAGEADNKRSGKTLIGKNSPVVLGKAVVGVVDFVGEKESRIRLITDPGLNPSVRIKRGSHLLAKGELKGAATPILRGRSILLLGVGFNYDFPDEEGPARDLRSGEPINKDPHYPPLPLVQPRDLLITTGTDGVFPSGLEVGMVQKIYPLREGDYAYELEAIPAAGNLNSLSLLFILPPTENIQNNN